MPKKKTFPKKLIIALLDDGTPIACETPEDIGEDFADDTVGVYELVAVGKFRVEKHVDAKLVRETDASRVCSACGHTRSWHATHRSRHQFKSK